MTELLIVQSFKIKCVFLIHVHFDFWMCDEEDKSFMY